MKFQNIYGFLHGGFVAAAAEFLSIACARTVVGEDKELFIGELSISYLSGAPGNVSIIEVTAVLPFNYKLEPGGASRLVKLTKLTAELIKTESNWKKPTKPTKTETN